MLEFPPLKITRGWDGARERCAENPSWDPALRAEALRALDWFRHHLEARRPWDGWERGHQLASIFFTRFQGGPPTGVRLYRLALPFSTNPAISLLVAALGQEDWTHVFGAVLELEIAAAIRTTRANVQLLTPEHETTTPDMGARPFDRLIVIECTAINASPSETKAFEVFSEILNCRESAVVTFGDEVHADDASHRISEILMGVRRAVAEHVSVELDDLCRVDPSDAASGCSVVGGLTVGASDREIVRLRRSVRNKARRKQLADRGVGVLVVRVPHLWRDGYGFTEVSREVTAALQDELGGENDITAVLVVQKWMSYSDAQVLSSIREGRLERDGKGTARASLLVPNPHARSTLSEDEVVWLAEVATRW